MSTIFDISLPISPSLVVWPGAPKTEFTSRRSIAKGDQSNNSNLSMNCHTGTHIDAPLHFIKDGAAVDQVSLDALLGEAVVLDLSNQLDIDVRTLETVWPKEGAQRVLLKTSNSRFWKEKPSDFVKDFCALTEESARWLLKKEVRLIGIDYLSIQHFGDSPIVHQILLEANVVLLEGLDLSRVPAGRYELICLPLKLVGVEASPVRAVLRSLAN